MPLLPLLLLSASIDVIVPLNGPKPVGPYSPGLRAGDYLYVSGQGAQGRQGIEAQTRECLNNVKTIVEAGGLTMDHVVYAQLCLADLNNYTIVDRIWREYFKTPPARITLAVTRMPTDTPIEITVVAHRQGKQKITGGALTEDRFYFDGTSFAQLDKVFKSAGVEKLSTAFLTIYHTSGAPLEKASLELTTYYGDRVPPHAFIEVPALPDGANLLVTGVAARHRKDRISKGDCSFIRGTAFCGLTADLEKADLTNVVATNVYIDNIGEFAEMNKRYAAAFAGKVLPTRTTVQPMPIGQQPKFQFSYVAAR